MEKGELHSTDFNQTLNAEGQRMGVRLCAPRFIVERETAQTGD